MTLLSHLGHPLARHPLSFRPPSRSAARSLAGARRRDVAEPPGIDRRVFAVQRIGALGVAVVLVVFGLLGATSGVGFLATHGERFLGMSSNGLLSALSLVVAAVLAGAVLRGPRTASTVMIALGVLFLLSALGHLVLLRTPVNLLAFRMSNVVFSEVVGLLLLLVGAYGRISGNLPANSPYAHPRPVVQQPPDLPTTPEEVAAEAAMREAEIAVVQHRATEDQRRRVHAMSQDHTRDGRRRIWMEFDVMTD
jgi:hypothetical protein